MFKKVLGKKTKSSKGTKEEDDDASKAGKLNKKKSKKSKDEMGSADSSDDGFQSDDDDSVQNSGQSPQNYDPDAEHGEGTDVLSPKSKSKKKTKEKKKPKASKDPLTPKKKKKKDDKTDESTDKDLGAKLGLLDEAGSAVAPDADETSLRSGTSARSKASAKALKGKKKKKKSLDSGDDEISVSSKRSKRGGKRSTDKEASTRKAQSVDALASDALERQPPDRTRSAYSKTGDDELDLFAENEALQSETVTLRKQLNEVTEELNTLRASQLEHRGSGEVTQMQIELKRTQNEVMELKMEVEEYEEAVSEKDGLIKKLTEAVDSQLDKVEYLELKLQRAEEEFCKMEDEMKDMEDEIETLRLDSAGRLEKINSDTNQELVLEDSNNSIESTDLGKDGSDHAEEQLIAGGKLLDERELQLQNREDALYDREQFLLDREEELRIREEELVEHGAVQIGDELDQIRIRELRLQEHEREVLELEDDLALKRQELVDRERRLEQMALEIEQKAREQDDISIGDSVQDSPSQANNLQGQNAAIELMQSKIEELSREKEDILKKWAERDHEDVDMKEMVDELKARVKAYQVEIAELKEASQKAEEQWTLRENEQEMRRDLELQTIQEGTNKQLKELDEENRRLRTECSVLKEQHETLKDSIPDEGIDPKDHAMAALQDEIASLREKIMDKEREQKITREEIARIVSENEEHRVEINDLETELASVTAQLRESKGVSSKKMEQKDETIAFMQNEIVRLMKEKQALDKKIRARRPGRNDADFLEKHSGHRKAMAKQEANEMAKVQAFSEQIITLDAENRDLREKAGELQEQLEKSRYEFEIKMKEKEARILQIEEDLADLNWEMKARKEADYVSLLKDRKERKKELDMTKKKLVKAEEVKADLERALHELKQNQRDLENDVAELNKSLVSRDSGDYVSGLKRQIRSLKEHNMALERKLEVESQAAEARISTKDERLAILEQEVKDLKNPAQAAVRGIFSFGLKSSDSSVKDSKHGDKATETEDGTASQDPLDTSRRNASVSSSRSVGDVPPSPNRTTSLWNALISPFGGSKRSIRSGKMDDSQKGVSPGSLLGNDDNDKEEEEEEGLLGPPGLKSDDDEEEEKEPHEMQQEKSSDDREEAKGENVENGQPAPPENDGEADPDVEVQQDSEGQDDDSLETAEDIDTDDDIDLTPDDDSDDEHGEEAENTFEEKNEHEDSVPLDTSDLVADDIDSQHPFQGKEDPETGSDSKSKAVVFL